MSRILAMHLGTGQKTIPGGLIAEKGSAART